MFGNDRQSLEVLQSSVGKIIAHLEITTLFHDDGGLIFIFTDNTRMVLFDNGRCCCESRYMITDDVLSDFIGSVFFGIEISRGPDEKLEYGEYQESEFLMVRTSKGTFTVVTYNEHNGYYGGFDICARAFE
jgi:hypothetical protein